MRICYVHEEYPNETNFGGIATYQKIIAEELAKKGHKIYVICRGIKRTYNYTENNVKVFRVFVEKVGNEKKEAITYRKKVCEILQKLQNNNEIDIIETPDWGANTIFFESIRRIPIVVRLHTPLKIWLKYNKNDFGPTKEQILKWENAMLKSCDQITSCSKILKNIVYDSYNLHDKKIEVIPNPANLLDFYRDDSIQKSDSLLYVGSLEERKGVCIFAKALNTILKKYPKLKVQFIGKDTNRNIYNISTKQLIFNIIEKKYHANIEFLGQLENNSLNEYLNSASVAVFPSLFDNFPYVVLEAMATGIHIVGSKNSGMIDMLDDKDSIYDTGNYISLANKVICKYEEYQLEKVNYQNINRVNQMYDPGLICNRMLKIYKITIENYNQNKVFKEDLENVLSNITNSNKILSFKREFGGVSNFVYRVLTKSSKYIIKKYIYNYDFNLCNKLYDVYEENKINVIRPLNKKIINYNGFCYNVFEYKKINFFKRDIPLNYIDNLLKCERKVNIDETITSKCNKYYLYLTKNEIKKLVIKEDVDYVISIYKKIMNSDLIKERYINHGDISKSNIIFSNHKYFIIDFDEVNVTTPLYDFAVSVIKLCIKNNKIDKKKYNHLKKIMINKYEKYTNCDLDNIIKFYLCKILIEKFYLYEIGKIDLFCRKQLKDNYKRYINILKLFDLRGEFNEK